jgi:predicted porin
MKPIHVESPAPARARGGRGPARLASACVLLAALGAAALAQAQTASDDSSLTWHGITLYGIVDLGLQYDTHSAPFSDYFPAGSGSLIQKNDYDSPTGITPSNLSQSRIGLSGNEPLIGDWAAVFKFETFFNPQTGDISDALKSVALNNGKAATSQEVGVDSSVAGQLFSGAAYIGFASPTYGSFTVGRNVTLLADGISKYDPMGAAQAFSLIGYSGTTAGGGDTEDRRLDQSVKYSAVYDWLHLGALYQFGSSNGAVNTGYQFQLGASVAGLSVDGYYFKKYDAISVSALSVDQVGELAGLCNPAVTVPATPSQCYSVSNSLSATISDNETYSVMALYDLNPVPLKLFGGYEHIAFNNPNNPLPAGTVTIGGYVLAFVSNTAYENQKTLEVYWAGLKYTIVPQVDLILAYYGYNQNSYATGKDAGCSTTVSGGCSGTEGAASIVIDYRLTKRFDVYAGSMWSGVTNGLANGYIDRDNIATTLGLRFKF